MRKNRLLIILGLGVFWMGKGVSQSATRMDSLVAAVNTYLDAYGGLSPFGTEELIPLNHSGLPAETLQYVKAHADKRSHNNDHRCHCYDHRGDNQREITEEIPK